MHSSFGSQISENTSKINDSLNQHISLVLQVAMNLTQRFSALTLNLSHDFFYLFYILFSPMLGMICIYHLATRRANKSGRILTCLSLSLPSNLSLCLSPSTRSLLSSFVPLLPFPFFFLYGVWFS